MCIVVLKHVLGLSILTRTLGDLMRKSGASRRSLRKAKKAHTVSSSKGEIGGGGVYPVVLRESSADTPSASDL